MDPHHRQLIRQGLEGSGEFAEVDLATLAVLLARISTQLEEIQTALVGADFIDQRHLSDVVRAIAAKLDATEDVEDD